MWGNVVIGGAKTGDWRDLCPLCGLSPFLRLPQGVEEILDGCFCGSVTEAAFREGIDKQWEEILSSFKAFFESETRETYRAAVEKVLEGATEREAAAFNRNFPDKPDGMAIYLAMATSMVIMAHITDERRGDLLRLAKNAAAKAYGIEGEEGWAAGKASKDGGYRAWLGTDGKEYGDWMPILSNPVIYGGMTIHQKRMKPKASTEDGKTTYEGRSTSFKVKVQAGENTVHLCNVNLTRTVTAIMLDIASRKPSRKLTQDDIEELRHVCLYFDEYQRTNRFTTEKIAQKALREGIFAIASTPIIWEGKIKVRDEQGNLKFGRDKKPKEAKESSYGTIGIAIMKKGADGKYSPKVFTDEGGRKYYKFSLNTDYARFMIESTVIPYYRKLLDIDTKKFPSALPMGNAAIFYWWMNRDEGQKMGDDVTMPNKMLFEASNLPDYERLTRQGIRKFPNGEIREYTTKGNGFDRQILQPFIGSLGELERVGLLSKVEGGADFQMEDCKSYEEFQNGHTKFHMNAPFNRKERK